MPPTTYRASDRLRIGVLLARSPVQLLDLAPVDLFHMLSKEYISGLAIMPDAIKALAINDVEIYYIAEQEGTHSPILQSNRASLTPGHTNENTSPGTNLTSSMKPALLLAPLTANAKISITSVLSDPQVQPGKLSILMIPGPDPTDMVSDRCRSFIQSHAWCGKTDVITVCTGIYPACQSGICDGQLVTGPRGLLSDLRSKFTAVKSFEDKRWTWCYLKHVEDSKSSSADEFREAVFERSAGETRSAELWTAAAITNGHDCIAAYIKAHFNQELAEIVCRMADVGARPRDYDTGQIAEQMWWLTRIVRAAVKAMW